MLLQKFLKSVGLHAKAWPSLQAKWADLSTCSTTLQPGLAQVTLGRTFSQAKPTFLSNCDHSQLHFAHNYILPGEPGLARCLHLYSSICSGKEPSGDK